MRRRQMANISRRGILKPRMLKDRFGVREFSVTGEHILELAYAYFVSFFFCSIFFTAWWLLRRQMPCINAII